MMRFFRKPNNEAKSELVDSTGCIKKPVLNEAINFDLRCIFIAIPKTGSTSVRSQLTQAGEPLFSNSHLNIVQVRDLIYPFLLKSALGANKSYPTEGVPADRDVRNEARQIFNDFFKFSAVRNPWARAVSIYFRREGVKLNEELTFEQFCERHLYASDTCMHPTLHNNQYDWLCDEDDKMIMDYVYKLENLDAAIDEIHEKTEGRLKLINVMSNKNPSSKSLNYREMYSDKTKRIISKNFEKDIDCFKYTF